MSTTNPSTSTPAAEHRPKNLEIALGIPRRILEIAERRRARFLERHPDSEADLDDFVIEHLDWSWAGDVPEYEALEDRLDGFDELDDEEE